MIDTLKDTYKTIFSRLTISIWAIATVGTVMAGPFGTFDSMNLSERCLYWSLITTTSIFLGYLAHGLARIVFGKQETAKSHILAGLLGTVFISADVFLISRMLNPMQEEPASFIQFLGWVGIVFAGVSAGRIMFAKEVQTTALSDFKATSVPSVSQQVHLPKIIRRLPQDDHGQVIRLSANDHFVHILTKAGEHPVRMRLRDAISEMDGIDGSLVHRSHWVAHEAIKGTQKNKGKLFVVLANGDQIPVSRNYRANVEALDFTVAAS